MKRIHVRRVLSLMSIGVTVGFVFLYVSEYMREKLMYSHRQVKPRKIYELVCLLMDK